MTQAFSFDTHGKLYENGTLVFERLLPGPIERVWAYVVDGQKRAKWFTAGDIPSVAGAVFTMTFDHTALSGEIAPDDYKAMRQPISFESRVISINAPHHVAFDFSEEDYIGIVSIDLQPFGDKVLLRLTHENPIVRRGIIGYFNGWHTHLLMLEDTVLGRTPRPFWTHHARVKAEYEAKFADTQQSVAVVAVTQSYKAAPSRVFNAFLDPAMIAKFMMGPDVRDEEIVHIELDPRVGGTFSFKVKRDGEIIDHVGTYYDITPPHRLSFSWGIAGESDEADSRVDMVITPAPDGGCTLILSHELDIKWAEYADRTRDGWAFMLGNLDKAL